MDTPITPDSFVRNCHLVAREEDCPLFIAKDGLVIARLDGYVICSREKLQEVAASLAEPTSLRARTLRLLMH